MDFSAVIKALETIKSLGLAQDLTHTMSQAAIRQFTTEGNNHHNIHATSVHEDEEVTYVENNDADKNATALPTDIENPKVGGNNIEMASRKKSFLQALTSMEVPASIPMPSTLTVTPPRFVGGNVIVEVDDESIDMEATKYIDDIHLKLMYQRGDSPHNLAVLKDKLCSAWGFGTFSLSHIGNGWFHIFLSNTDHQSIVLCKGPLHLKPGFIRVSRWEKNFNPFKQQQTNAQVWLHIHDLPMECRGADTLYCIARGAGWPIKIDPETQKKGPYVRIQVDADCSQKLPETLVVHKKLTGEEFWARVHYEFYP